MSEEPNVSYAEKRFGIDNTPREPTMSEQEIVDRAVCAASHVTGVPPSRVVGRGRTEEQVEARFIAYHICMGTNEFTLVGLGRCFGKDHGAIHNGLSRVKERLEDDSSAFRRFRQVYKRVRERYKAYEKDPDSMVQEFGLHDG